MRRAIVVPLMFAGALTIVMATSVAAQGSEDQHVLELMRASAVPGLQLTIIEHGAVRWTRGYGVRSSDTMDPVHTTSGS